MDDDLDAFDDLVDEDQPDELDAVVPEDQAELPIANFCLCGRDPEEDEVMTEIAKAMALIIEFALVPCGCVRDVAAAYDNIHQGLKTVAATQLCNTMLAARRKIEAHMQEEPAGDGPPMLADRSALH